LANRSDRQHRRGRDAAGKRGPFCKEIHASLGGLLLFLAALRVCRVAASGYVHRENPIRAMIAEQRRPPDDMPRPSDKPFPGVASAGPADCSC
jgi:cytochrome b